MSVRVVCTMYILYDHYLYSIKSEFNIPHIQRNEFNEYNNKR